MSRKLTFSLLVAAVLGFVACHKSNSGGGGGKLPGNYKFLYLMAQTQSVTQESGGGLDEKSITNTNYTTVQNTGTATITSDSIALKGVGFTANTNATSYIYDNGALTDSFSLPFSETIPAYTAGTKIDIIGSDSIYFHGGAILAGTGSSTVTQPSGGHFSFKGDTLFIVSKVSQTNPPQSSGGITATSSASAVETIVMLKQ